GFVVGDEQSASEFFNYSAELPVEESNIVSVFADVAIVVSAQRVKKQHVSPAPFEQVAYYRDCFLADFTTQGFDPEIVADDVFWQIEGFDDGAHADEVVSGILVLDQDNSECFGRDQVKGGAVACPGARQLH